MSVITGLFKNPVEASAAIEELALAGVPIDRISVVASEHLGPEGFGVREHSHVGEGAAIGAGAGGAIGALVAGFTAIGAIATGSVGLVAAGPLIAALAGAGAGAAAGGTLGGIVGLIVPGHEVSFYRKALDEGCVLIGVENEEDYGDAARRVFEDHDATKITNV